MRVGTPAPMARSVCQVSASSAQFTNRYLAGRYRDLHCSFLSIDSGLRKLYKPTPSPPVSPRPNPVTNFRSYNRTGRARGPGLLWKKITWSLHERENFMQLIKDVSHLLDQLETLFPSSETQRRLVNQDIAPRSRRPSRSSTYRSSRKGSINSCRIEQKTPNISRLAATPLGPLERKKTLGCKMGIHISIRLVRALMML